jgi:Pyridoxamine 5'-phosphate oxidase
VNWDAFTAACPEIADLARARIERDQLVLLGTLRADGSPRISPCEVDFAAGRLFLGMMWRSRKALDLLQDSRVVVHSVTCNKEGTEGDVKLYGRALDEPDSEVRDVFGQAILKRINWRPDEPYHLFSLDVERAGYIVFGETGHALIWDPERGLRRKAVH